MARRIRFLKPWQPAELTARTIQGRYLLAPSQRLRALLAGILAKARSRYRVRIHNFVFLSNHFHLLASAATQHELSRFMNFVMSNIAREAGRLHHWEGPFWGRRYTLSPIDDEPALLERMRYIFANGCKEGLVSHPARWPGLNAVEALTTGQPISGVWVDRTRLYLARRGRRADVDEEEFTQHHQFFLDPLPAWVDLSPSEQQEMAAELVAVAAESAPVNANRGLRASTVHDPHYRPATLKRGRAPICHASSRAGRAAFREAYRRFVEAYRRASEHLRDNLGAHDYPTHAQVLAFAMAG